MGGMGEVGWVGVSGWVGGHRRGATPQEAGLRAQARTNAPPCGIPKNTPFWGQFFGACGGLDTFSLLIKNKKGGSAIEPARVFEGVPSL